MCKGTKTTMACGHILGQLKAQCPPETISPCKQEEIQDRLINDTCADCDPEVRRKMLRAAYEQERVRLVARYREAKAAGDVALMASLEHQMMMGVSEVRAANFEIGLVKGDVDVAWES